jgi:putative redox protein
MPERPTTTIDVSWQGGLKFTSRDAYGHTLTVDAPENDGDSFDGFMPGDMMLTSLVGCSGIDVVGILQKQRQEVTGIDVRVTGVQNPDPPWTWEEIRLEYVVTGKGISAAAVERAIHLSETRYCSVGATLSGRATISSTFRIVEE